jgi:hypothetical protein
VLLRARDKLEPGAQQKDRPALRHPAQHASESTVGLLACGSPPVTAFPGIVPVAVWHGLAAYSCGGSCGLGTSVPHRIPCSLSCERPSMGALNGGDRAFVNATVAAVCGRASLGYSRFRRRFPRYRCRRVSTPLWRDPKGNAVRALPKAAAAPATVSGRHSSTCHWSRWRLREGRGKR